MAKLVGTPKNGGSVKSKKDIKLLDTKSKGVTKSKLTKKPKNALEAFKSVQSAKPDMALPKLKMAAPKPKISAPKPKIAALKPKMAVPKSEIAASKSEMAAPKPKMAVPKPKKAAAKSKNTVSTPETCPNLQQDSQKTVQKGKDEKKKRKITINIKGIPCTQTNIRSGVVEAMTPYGQPKGLKISKAQGSRNEYNVKFVVPSEELADNIIAASDSIQVNGSAVKLIKTMSGVSKKVKRSVKRLKSEGPAKVDKENRKISHSKLKGQKDSNDGMESTIKPKTKVYVGNLCPSTTKATLAKHFKKFGKIVEILLPTDKETNKMKGYGFVVYSEADMVEKAVKKANLTIDGREVTIKKGYSAYYKRESSADSKDSEQVESLDGKSHMEVDEEGSNKTDQKVSKKVKRNAKKLETSGPMEVDKEGSSNGEKDKKNKKKQSKCVE